MTEQHIELYKKYRPQVWSELIGQQKVAKSLQSAVVHKKIPTAYLFAGPRGCGKTSAALLLAKSINCLHPTEDGNPDNTCEVCRAIDNRTQLGVNYISMANKGSVDDIRIIVQQARLQQPVNRSIWILDEIQNLSKAAFDALLIPIEDPNMPSLFIFCSTDIDKIPQTILSRTQQRKFTLVQSETMRTLLEEIARKENETYSEAVLDDAIRQGRGSVRDTLSALETIVETGESASPSFSGKLLEALSKNDLPLSLSIVAEANNEGFDGRDLAEELFSDTRNLILLVSGVDPNIAGIVPVENIRETAKNLLGKRGMFILEEEIGNAITQMTIGADSRIQLEIALVKSLSKLAKLRKMIAASKTS